MLAYYFNTITNIKSDYLYRYQQYNTNIDY